MERYCRGPIQPANQFLHAPTTIVGSLNVDLKAQLRSSGRIIDASRVVLGGAEIIQVDFHLYSVIPNAIFAGWRIRYQLWPRDILIRRNMASSEWADIEAMAAGRDVEILDRDGAFVPQGEFLATLARIDPPNAGSTRWAVTTSDASTIQLQLQGLPASAPTLLSKPMLRK